MCAWSAGVFTRTNGVFSGSSVWNSDKGAGVNIVTSRHDTHDQDLAAGINACLVKDGTNSPTANLPMGGYKHTGVASASSRSEYASLGQVQDGAFIWLGTTGGVNGYTLTASATPAITAYQAGQRFRVIASLPSEGPDATLPHTLNINGLGAKNIVGISGSGNPTIGTWLAGSLLDLVYDGTNLRLLNDAGAWSTHSITGIGGGTMGVTVTTNHWSKFYKTGNIVHLSVSLTFTTSGSASAYIDFNLPVNAVNAGQFECHPCVIGDAAGAASFCRLETATQVRVLRDYTATTNWGIGAGRFFSLNISYQSV